ncbi:FAD-dependent oxidoreductase, partial [Burkholderia cenocepacia]|nr:FAD-dependent oxidoreductase [Burkholderia cenocepacia]
AMLARLAEAASAELLITELGAASLARWPQWLAELPEPVFFQHRGTLVVWHHADRAEAPLFERRVRANAPAELFDGGFVTLRGQRGFRAEPATIDRDMRGIRGEVARVRAPGIGLTRPVRLLHPRYPLYIAPKQDDLYVIGATEVEGEDMSPVSVRSALELLSAAFSVHPALGEARIL